MNEFYIILPTAQLPSVKDWQKRLRELEPNFSLDEKFDPLKGGVWECSYKDEESSATFCCDFSLEKSGPLFEKAPELQEYASGYEAVATFYADEEEDELSLAAAYALAESLLSLVPKAFLFDPFEGELLHSEDAIAFLHEELGLVEEDDEE